MDEFLCCRGCEGRTDFRDVAKVEEGYFDQLANVGLKGEGGVEDHAKVTCLGGGGNRSAIDVECEVVGFGEGGFGADEEELCFVAVEF